MTRLRLLMTAAMTATFAAISVPAFGREGRLKMENMQGMDMKGMPCREGVANETDAPRLQVSDAGDGHHGDSQGVPSEAAPGGVPADTLEAAFEAFAAALKSGDETALRSLLLPDVVVAEGGGAERCREEYAGHHMPADMEFSKDVEATVKDRRIIEGTDVATVITTMHVHGAFHGKTIHPQTIETMVLRRINVGWRIAHIHWPLEPNTGKHEDYNSESSTFP